jgi:hypothetical protein
MVDLFAYRSSAYFAHTNPPVSGIADAPSQVKTGGSPCSERVG